MGLEGILKEPEAKYITHTGGGGNPSQIMLFLDAYDVLVDAGEEEIVRRCSYRVFYYEIIDKTP